MTKVLDIQRQANETMTANVGKSTGFVGAGTDSVARPMITDSGWGDLAQGLAGLNSGLAPYLQREKEVKNQEDYYEGMKKYESMIQSGMKDSEINLAEAVKSNPDLVATSPYFQRGLQAKQLENLSSQIKTKMLDEYKNSDLYKNGTPEQVAEWGNQYLANARTELGLDNYSPELVEKVFNANLKENVKALTSSQFEMNWKRDKERMAFETENQLVNSIKEHLATYGTDNMQLLHGKLNSLVENGISSGLYSPSDMTNLVVKTASAIAEEKKDPALFDDIVMGVKNKYGTLSDTASVQGISHDMRTKIESEKRAEISFKQSQTVFAQSQQRKAETEKIYSFFARNPNASAMTTQELQKAIGVSDSAFEQIYHIQSSVLSSQRTALENSPKAFEAVARIGGSISNNVITPEFANQTIDEINALVKRGEISVGQAYGLTSNLNAKSSASAFGLESRYNSYRKSIEGTSDMFAPLKDNEKQDRQETLMYFDSTYNNLHMEMEERLGRALNYNEKCDVMANAYATTMKYKSTVNEFFNQDNPMTQEAIADFNKNNNVSLDTATNPFNRIGPEAFISGVMAEKRGSLSKDDPYSSLKETLRAKKYSDEEIDRLQVDAWNAMDDKTKQALISKLTTKAPAQKGKKQGSNTSKANATLDSRVGEDMMNGSVLNFE